MEPTIQTIKEAHSRIKSYIHKTPVLTCKTFDQLINAELFFKCENFQKVGAFKMRGAANAVFSLTEEEAQKGVASHSSGNHAAALALAAHHRGIKAYIVMPKNSPKIKKDAVAGYGAEIILCDSTLSAREAGLDEVVQKTGATFIHPYNDYHVIAGQGTAALELCNEVNNLDVLITPVGGGGLLSGTLIAAQSLLSDASVFAGEPFLADDAWQSVQTGNIVPPKPPITVADGLRTALGNKTFPIIKNYVQEIIRVSEEEIVSAMHLIWERMKIVIEPSAAVPFAAVLSRKELFINKRVGIILSGGNVDLLKLPWL